MNPNLLNPTTARSVARDLFLLLHQDQAAWFDLAWASLETSKVAAPPLTIWQNLPGLGAVDDADPTSQKMARDFAVMATTFLIESPMARSELLVRLKEACSQRGFAQPIQTWLTQAAEEILGSHNISVAANSQQSVATTVTATSYLVWQLQKHDVRCGDPEACDNERFVRGFWEQRKDYDLFVNGRLVFAPKRRGDQELKLAEEEYCALVFLLLNRSQPVTPMALYRQVYEHERLVQGLAEADIMTSHVKPLISHVRSIFETSVPALSIPDKRLMRGYVLQGAFDSCLALLQSDAARFFTATRRAR